MTCVIIWIIRFKIVKISSHFKFNVEEFVEFPQGTLKNSLVVNYHPHLDIKFFDATLRIL